MTKLSRSAAVTALSRLAAVVARVARRALNNRAAPVLLVVGAALASIAALLPGPAVDAPPPRADYAMVIGVAGLRWDDVTEADTPTLWRLARHGAVAALSVRSARRITCPADGWLTLGAGRYASRVQGTPSAQCPPLAVPIDQSDGLGASVGDQQQVVRDNRASRWGAQPGALAEAVRCTSAVGIGAAVAAARPYGRVDRYAASVSEAGPAGLAARLAACALSIVDLGTVAGEGPPRQATAHRADLLLAETLAARPERSLVLVAGLSDTEDVGRLHVAVADGPGYRGGWLTSPTTGRPGYLELVDLAPTVLAALDRPVPAELFAGAAATRAGSRPVDPDDALARLADADRETSVQRHVADWFFRFLALGQVLLFIGVIPLLRRARRPAGPRAPAPYPSWVGRGAEVLLIAAALAVPAALVADLVPWWRWHLAGLVFAAVTLGLLAAGTALVLVAGGSGRRTLGLFGVVAAVAAAAVAVDVMTGSRLQLNGVAGYSAVTGARYSGVGTVGLGVLAAGFLLVAGTFAQRVRRALRPGVVAVIGAIGVVVIGSPYLGADAAGAAAFSAGVCIAAAMSTGGWLTLSRIAWAVLTASAVTSAFAGVDLTRPPERRGNIGRFLVDLGDSGGGLAARRLAESNVVTAVPSPLTLLVIGATLFVGFVLLRSWGGLRRVFGLYPAVRAALAGIVIATVLAGLVEGVGLNVLGAAIATTVPLAALAARRALRSADDRTQPVRIEPASASEPAASEPAASEPAASEPAAALGVAVPPEPRAKEARPAPPAPPGETEALIGARRARSADGGA